MHNNVIFRRENDEESARDVSYLCNIDASDWQQQFMIYLNKTISNPEDLKGMKLRSSPTFKTVFQHFGAVPVAMKMGDVNLALKNNLVEGLGSTADEGVISYSIYEVCKYFVTPGFGMPENVWLWNLNSWETIPPDFKKIITETVVDVEAEWETKMNDYHKSLIDEFEKHGMKKIVLDEASGKRLTEAYNDSQWKWVIEKSPNNGAQLRKLAGLPPLPIN